MQSGINTLPLVLSLVVSSILAGIITQKIGYYVPSMLIAPAIMSVGEGLMTTFNRDTPPSQWIAYQFLAGFGLGFGMQTSGLAIQTVLPKEDVSIGIAINFFLQQLGGAISTSIGQSILSNLLGAQVAQIPGFSAHIIVGEGATHLVDKVPPEYRDLVIDGYNFACQRIFLAAAGFAFAALLCALGMEWKSIKKGKNGQGPPGSGGPGGPGVPGGPGQMGPGGPGMGPGPNGDLPSPMIDMHPRQSMDPRTSNMSMGKPPLSAGYDTNSHASTGVIALDGSGSHHYSMLGMPGASAGSHYSIIMPGVHGPNGSNLSLPTAFDSNPYNPAIAPVVFVPHTGDPGNPYGQMAMYDSPYGNAMMPVPVMYVNPGFAPPPVPNADGHRDSLCNNCRCSVQGIPGMPGEASSSTSLPLADEKDLGRRSRASTISGAGR